MIDQAIKFITDNVHDPALAHPNLPEKIKNKVKNNKVTINNFKKVGDLYNYLNRFANNSHGGGGLDTYNEMNAHGLKSLETIFDRFTEKFKYELNDFTVLSDFTIGEIYTSFDISNFAKTYNNMPGIYLIGNGPKYEAIFTKVTLGSDRGYPNEWITKGLDLKHYSEARNNVFSDKSLSYKRNTAFLDSNKYQTPIYVFIKVRKNEYSLEGNFKFIKYEHDKNGGIYFRLSKTDIDDQRTEITLDAYNEDLELHINQAKKCSKKERKERLKNSPRKPKKQRILVSGYKRNPYVIVEVLERAAGVCESCKKKAPFIRFKDNSPYLEVHHIIQLANGGEDTVENAMAVCPNCHRNRHYGIDFNP